MRQLKHLDLFSGIGGFALAARWMGFETVGFCENDVECVKTLKRHWPNVTIENDIKDLNGGKYKDVDIITGGYPCQPYSVAGSRKAEKDDRYIFPEMLRVIAQAKPTWVVCENVYGHLSLGLDSVLHKLEGIGYTTQPFVIPSLATGANHNRRRIFIVAYSTGNGRNEGKVSQSDGEENGNSQKGPNKNRYNERRGGLWVAVDRQGHPIGRRGTEPPPLRVDVELPRRMDRNRILGNAIDPMIAYEIFRCIDAY